MMNMKIVRVSQEPEPFVDMIKDTERFSGQAAAVCYMKDKYDKFAQEEPEKSLSRFERVVGTGHHSISDHCFITVLFEDIPKMTAMILNSLGFYNTSEKSGRYTVMSSTGLAKEVYDKWVDIYKNVITRYDKILEEKLVDKLALENARYVLNVFESSTTMVYTTSLRMWSYIVHMCKDYLQSVKDKKDKVISRFDTELYSCIQNLLNMILKCGCFSESIESDYRNSFTFLSRQTGYNIYDSMESFAESYVIHYKCSFACLAQLQRHRKSIEYFMDYDGVNLEDKYYVPPVLTLEENSDYKTWWLKDLEMLKQNNQNYFPIATLVDVWEIGNITGFMRKCDERLCGRTQLETYNNVSYNLFRFDRQFNKTKFMKSQLSRHIDEQGNIIMKCGKIKCKEPCHWGPIKSKCKMI